MKKTAFYGQQEGERILYEARPHRLGLYLALGQVIVGAAFLIMVTLIVSNQFSSFGPAMGVVGLILGAGLLIVGIWVVTAQSSKNVVFITDRRVVRFLATTPWTINSRSLFWDEVVKVKTYSESLIKRMFNVGSMIIHARTETDDLLISELGFYADLGNYLDKIIYLYKQKKETELANLRPFIAKPKGKRY